MPRYGSPLFLTADVEERRGADPLVTLRGYFAGLPVEAVVRTVARSPHSVDVTQVRGTLRGFSQRFTIESDDEATLLNCRVEADPGIPMLSDEAVKHFLVQHVERMLDRLRLAAERRAPARRPLRPAARAEGAADTEEGPALDGAAPESPESEHAQKEAAAPASAPAPPVSSAAAPDGAPDKRPPADDTLATSRRPGGPRSAGRPSATRGPARAIRSPRQSALRPDAPSHFAPPVASGETPAVPAAATDAVAEAASGGQGRRRKRRRRRRGRGGTGTPAPGGGPKPSGDTGGEAAGPQDSG